MVLPSLPGAIVSVITRPGFPAYDALLLLVLCEHGIRHKEGKLECIAFPTIGHSIGKSLSDIEI